MSLHLFSDKATNVGSRSAQNTHIIEDDNESKSFPSIFSSNSGQLKTMASLWQSLRSVVSYAPIPLFAESLRVQKTIVSCILSTGYVPSILTGCIKDLDRLWNMDDLELFGHFEDTQSSSVVSLRHGSTFGLANKTVLLISGLIGKKKVGEPVFKFTGPRTTTVNVSFIVPMSSKNSTMGRLSYMSFIIKSLELVVAVVLAILLFFNGINIGVLLLACVATTHLILLILQQLL